MAGPTIEFIGNLTDEALIRYYMGCKALLFPGHEDLGLSIIEVQKFGRPVIAYKAGGALETVVDGKTGYFFTPQTKSALVKALKMFIGLNGGLSRGAFDRKYKSVCQKQAQKFSQESFQKEIRQLVEKVIQ